LGLNHLWQLQLPKQQLVELARDLGADVPVFVNGKTAFAQGVGEILQPLDLAENWFVIIAPICPVSTAEIFSHKGLTRDTPVIKVAASFEQGTRNDCQALVRKLYKPVDEALNWLGKFGDAKLTGTGSCVFLKVDTESDAHAIFEQRPLGWQGFTARGINQSPVLDLLQAP
jgi:4-diphosphocytidyl-2-C-methyl-D-erythritol kinase